MATLFEIDPVVMKLKMCKVYIQGADRQMDKETDGRRTTGDKKNLT